MAQKLIDGLSDYSRRDLLRTAGQGMLVAGLATPLTALAADVPPGQQANPARPPTPTQPSAATPPPGEAPAGKVPLAPPDKQPPDVKIPKLPGKKVGYAIVGIGQLALEEILPAFRVAEKSQVVALVSGHADKAKQVAAYYGVDEKSIYDYKTMERLRDNPAVDVVYVVTPNSLHAEHTLRALDAGKHVLCEKPMAASVQECEQMVGAAKRAGKKLMIAYRLHYEPYNQAMIDMARKKAYGPIRLIEASNVQNIKAPNIRLSKDLAGGALMDIGIYCLNAARYITGEEPTEVSGWTYSDPSDSRFREVDETVVFNLKFPSGVIAACSASHGGSQGRRYRVYAANGWTELDPAFSYRGLRMKISTMKGEEETHTQEVQLREVNQFAAEMDHFSECVREDKQPWTPGEEGLQDLRLITRIFEAVREGKTIKV